MTVVVEQTITASREEVFAHLTEPARFDPSVVRFFGLPRTLQERRRAFASYVARSTCADI